MNYLWIKTTTIIVVLSSFALFITPVHAEPDLDSIKKDRSKIKEDVEEAEAEIEAVLLEIKRMNEEAIRLEAALVENKRALESAKEKIIQLEEEGRRFEAEIEEIEKKIEVRSEILKKRISSLQKNGGNLSYLDVVLGSKDFGEFISRLSAVTKITTSDRQLIEKQETDKAIVEEKRLDVKQNLSEQKELETELNGMLALIKEQQIKTKQNKTNLEAKEQRLRSLKSELTSEDHRLAVLEAQIRNDISGYNPAEPPKANKTNSAPAPVRSNTGIGSKTTAIQAGYQYIGTPYRWAGKSPSGFDCSGFVSWAYGQAGYSLPSSTAGLSSTGSKVSYNEIQPGDLVFFDTYKKNGHVGIYVGGGSFIGSQNSTGLAVASMNSTYWKKTFKGHVRRIN
ncbi:C40 family peptidase [Virgibacillus sp. W0430]|uniref:C40 family peptidase n=1 Tax=Virgibacillus sp. W0430 TaxID=3391580 RepID=UPI003F485D3F